MTTIGSVILLIRLDLQAYVDVFYHAYQIAGSLLAMRRYVIDLLSRIALHVFSAAK